MYVTDLPDDTLLEQLRAKYERTAPGHCPQCGTVVEVEPHEGGYPLPWACPVAREELDAARARGASQEELQPLLAHWESSRWEDFRRLGDRRVMELIRRYLLLKEEAALSPCDDSPDAAPGLTA